jgi:hypothetical protein
MAGHADGQNREKSPDAIWQSAAANFAMCWRLLRMFPNEQKQGANPCYGPLTGNFFKKRADNRGFSGRRRQSSEFSHANSMSYNAKINFPVIRDNRAF